MYPEPTCLNLHPKILYVKKTHKLILRLIRLFSHFNNSFGLWDALSKPTYKCSSLQRLQNCCILYAHIKCSNRRVLSQISADELGQHSVFDRLSAESNDSGGLWVVFWDPGISLLGYGRVNRLDFVTLEPTINEGLFCVFKVSTMCHSDVSADKPARVVSCALSEIRCFSLLFCFFLT